MRTLKLFISFWLVAGCFSASAVESVVSLWAWNPGPEYPTYILPGRAKESNIEVIQNYIRSMRASPALKAEIPLTAWDGIHYDPTTRPSRLPVKELPQDRLLLLANGLRDHMPGTVRLNQFIPRFKNLGFTSYVLPVGATARFSREERTRIHKLLGQNFGTINPLGGADVAPEFYAPEVTHAKEFNAERDRYEIELIQDIYKFTQAKITGPCRAMQIVCVALGCSLYQDVHKDLKVSEVHGGGETGVEHPVHFLTTSTQLAQELFQDLESWFKSDHHQSVKIPADSIFEVAAVSYQGVIEAVVSRDNRIVLIQGHAERPDSQGAGEIYYQRLARWMKKPNSVCHSILTPKTRGTL